MTHAVELNQFLAGVEKRAYAIAVMSVKNPEDALDIVQDVMMTLASKYAAKPSTEWPPIFYRILRNRITDHHRLSVRHRRWFGWLTPHTEEDNPLENSPGHRQYEPEQKHRAVSNGVRLVEAIEQLPARQREAFVFRAWEGLDVKGTARVMGCSEGSVKTHYSRAVKSLRAQLGDLVYD